MVLLVLAALFFAGIHLGIAGTKLRDRVVSALGTTGFRIAFSLATVAGLLWMVLAYRQAPYIAVWTSPEWWKPVAIMAMLPAFLLVVIGLATPNPTAVAQEGSLGRGPIGIVRITRHPFLTGVTIWALVHLVANGDGASAVFFATWAVVALAGMPSIDAKRRRLQGVVMGELRGQDLDPAFRGDPCRTKQHELAGGRPMAPGRCACGLCHDAGRSLASLRRLALLRAGSRNSRNGSWTSSAGWRTPITPAGRPSASSTGDGQGLPGACSEGSQGSLSR